MYLSYLFQMLPSHPFLTGNPLLQQQMKQQLPLFMQQVCLCILNLLYSIKLNLYYSPKNFPKAKMLRVS